MIRFVETERADEYGSQDYYSVQIYRDGKRLSSMGVGNLSECPEDATLNRDLGFIYNAITIFKLGIEAGKSGEEVQYESKEEK